MSNFEHEKALQENNIPATSLPRSIKAKINRFRQLHAKYFADPNNVDPKKKVELEAYSAAIADEIQDFYEQDFEEQESNNQNQNTMSKKEYAHPELLKQAGVKVADLPKAIQDALTTFNSSKDEKQKDDLDQKLYGMIQDHIEEEKHKSQKKSAAAMDVSSAGTAVNANEEATKAAAAAAAAAKNQSSGRSPLKTIFGYK